MDSCHFTWYGEFVYAFLNPHLSTLLVQEAVLGDRYSLENTNCPFTP